MTRALKKGFTLIELMVVVALIGIIGALSIVSFAQGRTMSDIDNWVSTNRDAILVASRRAMATGQPYMVYFTPTTVQWCLVNNLGTGTTYTSPQANCAGLPATVEQGPLNSAVNRDVFSSFYAPSADAADANGNYVAAPQIALTTQALYFGRTGASSTQLVNVMSSGIPTPTALGFTLYIRRSVSDDAIYRRKMVVYGLASKVRVIDRY